MQKYKQTQAKVTLTDMRSDWKRSMNALFDQIDLMISDPAFPDPQISGFDRRSLRVELELIANRFDHLLSLHR